MVKSPKRQSTRQARKGTPTKGPKRLILSVENLAFLKEIGGQSEYVNGLLDRRRKQEDLMTSSLTEELVRKYRDMTGLVPEIAYQKFLRKRIERLEKNRLRAQSGMAGAGNLAGIAFMKLSDAFAKLCHDNESRDLKIAVTYGVLFRMAGCNQQTIRNWMRANQVQIDHYHQSLGIENPQIHNRQVAVVERVRRQRGLATGEDVSSSAQEKTNGDSLA